MRRSPPFQACRKLAAAWRISHTFQISMPSVNPTCFLIYYGYPEIPVIELARTPDIEAPPSMHDTGFAVTDSASLRELRYGMTVGEAAAFWKTHKRTAPRVYTNADIQRLHRS
jgi:hypothetical protein